MLFIIFLFKMDSITKPERRKLSALALFSMFSTKRKYAIVAFTVKFRQLLDIWRCVFSLLLRVLQERFPVIIETIVDVLHELNKGDSFPAE